MGLLRYISHAQVIQDPAVPVPRWSLSAEGRRRVEILADQPWVASIGRLVASDETKAVEAAAMLGDRLDLEVEIRPASGEIDRSATGYVSRERHDELAARHFARPDESADGWELAVDAQQRVVEALADLAAEPTDPPPDPARPDMATIGHGAVGTLLWCRLSGVAISQRHDQAGQGHYWTWDRSSQTMLHGWLPIDG